MTEGKTTSAQWSIRTTYLLMQGLQEPFIAIYSMLVVLLTKNMGASPFQIALLNMLKPTVSVLSFYWGSYLHNHLSLIKPSLILLTLLSTLPFLFSPWFSSIWAFIFLGAWYSLFSRAAIPASLEVLKLNTERSERERLFSSASIMGYAIGAIFSIGYGSLLDTMPFMWQWLLSIAALFHISSIAMQYRMPAQPMCRKEILSSVSQAASQSSLKSPWIQAKELMKRRPDFCRFQLGFSIAGFGLMFSQPAIPAFVTGLHFSYMDLFIAFSMLKGLGFIMTSPLWARYVSRYPIHTMSSTVFFGFALFLIALVFSIFDPIWLFIAYFTYGVAQAGSHLVWNLSGSIFAQNETSTPYTSVNVLMVGLRGAVAPPLGGIVTEWFGSPCTMIVGALLCLAGMYISTSETSSHAIIEQMRRYTEGIKNILRSYKDMVKGQHVSEEVGGSEQ